MDYNICGIDNDKPVTGLVDTNVLRKALRALEQTMLHLLGAMGSTAAGLGDMLKIARENAKLSAQIRAAEVFNLNLRRRDWILSSIERRLWLRGLIGEKCIARWVKRRGVLADTAFEVPKLKDILKPQSLPKQQKMPARQHIWYTLARQTAGFRPPELAKLAGLAKLAQVAKISFPNNGHMYRAEFYPHELTAEYVYDGNPVASSSHCGSLRRKTGASGLHTGQNTGPSNYASARRKSPKGDPILRRDERKKRGGLTAQIHKPP